MALYYRTEYRLGNRGRVCRSYTGFPAFVAIVMELVFGLLFELVFSVFALATQIAVLAVHLTLRLFQLYWRFMIAAMTLVVYAVTMPFVWIHDLVDGLRYGGRTERDSGRGSPEGVRKPSWAFSREV
jgi:hypothetical protein